MADYEIHFSQEDVLRKFIELKELYDSGEISDSFAFVHHELVSDLTVANMNCNCLLNPTYDIYLNADEKENLLELKSYCDIVYDSLNDLFNLIYQKTDNVLDKNLNILSAEFFEGFQRLSEFLPIREIIHDLTPLSEEMNEILNIINASYKLAFYRYNLDLANNFESESYHLNSDLKEYHLSTCMEIKSRDVIETGIINIERPRINNIETKVDYFGNVILPLISNIRQHAFNTENDIYSRQNNEEKPFYRWVYVTDYVDEKNKNITITVKDNGFGISPEIKGNLFQRGASTKTDTLTDHGIGLWGAKEFVEQNGGTMWCDAELGKNTSFSFTIPYSEKNYFNYKQ
ncbi:MAG: hypothetical protein GQ477_05195 [Nanohaloarchaea archaeon]|nr:hypothetical protein [Candidatus Nanohaloarchaea archaeon]